MICCCVWVGVGGSVHVVRLSVFYMYVSICLCVYACVCMYVCVCISLYVCMYCVSMYLCVCVRV
jgi:hypothetical protein